MFLVVLAILLSMVTAVSAAVITISNSTDAIQTAITHANSGDTIILNPGIYYENTITFSKNLTIRANTSAGGDQTNTIIDGGRGHHGIFMATGSSHSLAIDNLTLRNGRGPYTNGGAIFSEGTVTVTSCAISNCSGSAIFSLGTGTVTVTSSTISNCSGGAIFSLGTGTVTVTSSIISNCSGGWGGAIEANTVTVTSSTISNCSAGNGKVGGSGGAIYSESTVTVTSSTISNCSAGNGNEGGSGGAIYSEDTVTVTSSTITNCLAGNGYGGGSGGAIYSEGTVTVTSSTITNCLAGNGNSGNGGYRGGDGGAIYSEGTVTVTSSTISNCSAGAGGWGGGGGAIYSGGTITITLSTITNCSAGTGGYGGYGGAIFSQGTVTIMTLSTITNCSAGTGNAGGGGGAIYSEGTVTVTSSTITNCSAGTGSVGGNGNGGAIYGSGTIQFCRLVNDDVVGTAVWGYNGDINATDNWWGSNYDPSDQVSKDVMYDPWLVLGITATPPSITQTQKSKILANFTHDSDGNDTLSFGYVPDGIFVIYSVSSGHGSVSPESVGTLSGISQAAFTPTAAGKATVNVTVDSQTVSALIDIIPDFRTY
jgi:adhesin HecA-like repeat protein